MGNGTDQKVEQCPDSLEGHRSPSPIMGADCTYSPPQPIAEMEVGESQVIVLEVPTLDISCSKTTSKDLHHVYPEASPGPQSSSIKYEFLSRTQKGRNPSQLVGTRGSLVFRLLLPPAWYLEEI